MGETSLAQSYAPGVGRKHKRSPIAQAADLTIKAMLLQGGSLRKIAAALHVSPTTVLAVKKRMLTQAPDAKDLKSGLMSPSLGQKSVAVIDHFLDKGKKLKVVKGSDVMAAVKVVADRQWPVRQEHSPASFNFANVNLNIFLPDPQPAAQDVTPTPICSDSEDGNIEKTNSLNEFNTSNVS